jgi:hypothetical protein
LRSTPSQLPTPVLLLLLLPMLAILRTDVGRESGRTDGLWKSATDEWLHRLLCVPQSRTPGGARTGRGFLRPQQLHPAYVS